MGTATRRKAVELLRIEESDAWSEYLTNTRGQPEGSYEEAETWAWARLQQKLRGVKARQAKVAK
jgi:hypothetical protein